jgi:hypothetical protein
VQHLRVVREGRLSGRGNGARAAGRGAHRVGAAAAGEAAVVEVEVAGRVVRAEQVGLGLAYRSRTKVAG